MLHRVLALSLGAFALPLTASADLGVSGACTGPSDFEFDLYQDAEDARLGRVEVEFEVESGVRGQRWRVTLFQDGDRIGSATRRTRGRDGEFWVAGYRPVNPGDNAFVIVAENLRNGETCEAELVWTG